MQGTSVFEPILGSLLASVKERMSVKPLNNMLKKHLLGVYLSAVLQNREAALQYFESQGMTADLVKELLNLTSQMRHTYEMRLFIIGFSELLQNTVLPESLRPLLKNLISELINMNIKLKQREEKQAYEKEKKKSSKEEDSEDFEDDDDDEEEDDDDNQLADDMNDDDSDEAVDGDKKIRDDDLGFSNKRKLLDSEDEAYGSDDDESTSMMVSYYSVILASV